jgi:histidyl-tRNA synthetase
MSLQTQPYKGARDFYPEDKRLQKYMFAKLCQVVESFGYQEYDAPIIEPFEIYAAKSGDEIVNEQLYSFEDKGGRKVAIRPEMTPSVSRMVAARRQELAYPLRLYSIPNLWRYERPQRGRLREHWQLNVDLFGVEGVEGDAEIVQIADAILKSFDAAPSMYKIKVNSRKAMHEILEAKGYEGKIIPKIIGLFDRLGKPSYQKYLDENFSNSDKTTLNEFISNVSGSSVLESKAGQKLSELIAILRGVGITADPDITLNRGFDYYDDIVFEVFDTDPENNRSMFGGGRYNGLVGLFGVDSIATVGFGMGDVTLRNFLETHNLLPQLKPETDVTVILVGNVYSSAQPAIKRLRKLGLNIAIDSGGRKIDSQIKNAVKSGVRHAIFIGDHEIESEKYKLRDLEKGSEKELTIEQIAEILKVNKTSV